MPFSAQSQRVLSLYRTNTQKTRVTIQIPIRMAMETIWKILLEPLKRKAKLFILAEETWALSTSAV